VKGHLKRGVTIYRRVGVQEELLLKKKILLLSCVSCKKKTSVRSHSMKLAIGSEVRC
jgi:hypothetical protein